MPKRPMKAHDAAVMNGVLMTRRKPFTELKDFSQAPAALEAAIDRGDMDGMVTFYRLKNGHLGMMNGGFTAEGLFDVLCELRRVMIATQGLVDEDETALVKELRGKLADIEAGDAALREELGRLKDHFAATGG